ncbi:hypothetical protein Tco_1297867 [Tanacetum coccineum]
MSQPANDEFSQHLSDDEESNHEDASDTGVAPKQKQQAMEMEHYLEYIDNDVWKAIQNGNSKKRISTGKDGIVRILSPVTAAGMKAVKEKEHLQKTLDSWKDSFKNLWRLINSGMSSNNKLGLGYEIQSNNEVLSYEEEMNFSVFNCIKEDSVGKPLYSRFV